MTAAGAWEMQNCIAKVKKLILPCVEWVFHDSELDKNI